MSFKVALDTSGVVGFDVAPTVGCTGNAPDNSKGVTPSVVYSTYEDVGEVSNGLLCHRHDRRG